MKQHRLLVILLVASCWVIAHAKTYHLNKNLLTSLLTSQGKAIKNQLNLEDDNFVTIQTPSSAVRDWSLVCQQLCGAALGGAICAPYCKNLPFLPFNVQLNNAKDIMDSKRDLICPELCGIQLGDDVCTCKNYNKNDIDAYMKIKGNRNVCAIICDYTSVTLTGCTPCNGDVGNSEYKILETSKTFNQVVPFETYKVTPSTTTTPDWNQLCASLCKTGDGGSLCNCDLSPFLLKF